jgi:hypothetical protein
VLNVYGVHNVRQMDIQTVGKLKICKSPSTDQIPDELIKGGGERLCSEIFFF